MMVRSKTRSVLMINEILFDVRIYSIYLFNNKKGTRHYLCYNNKSIQNYFIIVSRCLERI